MIAIAENALDIIVADSNLKAGHGKAKIPNVPTDRDGNTLLDGDLVNYMSRLKRTSARDNLLASISRVAGHIDCSVDSSVSWFRADNDASVRELVHCFYKFHKRGDLEPELPFLRFSNSHGIQTVECQDKAPFRAHDDLQVSKEGAVLIHGGHNCHQMESPSQLCVFLIQDRTEPPKMGVLARIIKTTFEDQDVYHTRDNGMLNLGKQKRYRDIWNLEKSYGVFFPYGPNCFSRWLGHLNMPLPTRQGSPRGPLDTARIIFEREYTPWHDHRLLYGGSRAQRKKNFLKQLFVAEVTEWASIAQRRIRQGRDCCVFCAGELNPDRIHHPSGTETKDDNIIGDLCTECQEHLDINSSRGFPRWVKRWLLKAHSVAFSMSSSGDMAELDSSKVYKIIAHPRDLVQDLSPPTTFRPYNLIEDDSDRNPGRDTESFDGGVDETPDVNTERLLNPESQESGALDEDEDLSDGSESQRHVNERPLGLPERMRLIRKRKLSIEEE